MNSADRPARFAAVKKPANTQERLVLVVGTAFGLGLAPIAPGSFAALAGVAWHALVWKVTPGLLVPLLAAGLVAMIGLHFWLNEAAARYWEDDDSGNFVLDEVAGYLVTALAACALPNQWIVMAAGFLLFRILDIIKLPGARYFDRQMHNAWGVLLDDVVSGLYAAGLLWAAHYLKWF